MRHQSVFLYTSWTCDSLFLINRHRVPCMRHYISFFLPVINIPVVIYSLITYTVWPCHGSYSLSYWAILSVVYMWWISYGEVYVSQENPVEPRFSLAPWHGTRSKPLSIEPESQTRCQTRTRTRPRFTAGERFFFSTATPGFLNLHIFPV